jgi:MFS family permease
MLFEIRLYRRGRWRSLHRLGHHYLEDESFVRWSQPHSARHLRLKMNDGESPRRRSSTRRASEVDEAAPLSLSRTRSQELIVAESAAVQAIPEDDRTDSETTVWPQSVRYFVLLCACLTSFCFGITQVPLLYVFRLMTCDAYYKGHQLPDGAIDKCSIHAIESSTALSVSLLGASTTVFGTLNLFLTGTLIKSIGVKPTLMTQTFFPALRLLIQTIGVEVWGSMGIIIVQCSQIVTIVGGPSGYMLALNTFITEVVEHEGRTAALGRLTGCMMFGSAVGFLLGGVVAESFGIKAPFYLTFFMFTSATIYVYFFLPHIPPAERKGADTNSPMNKQSFVKQFFGPLTVFSPQKFITPAGAIQTEFGIFLLACGVFLGITATGYLPTMLQLYATDVFNFRTQQNGFLIFVYSTLRGVFLTFMFPKLIAVGRRWTADRELRQAADRASAEASERAPLLPNGRTTAHLDGATESESPTPKKEQTFRFDLTYTRFSLIADGLLTLLCSFVWKGWQMYLVACILPFAAGTGAAAKGTVLQMVGSTATSAERTDALAGISLIENMARLSTTFIFGVVFAAFASIGRTELVFTCNAAVALIGFGVLLFARFPPDGSRRLDAKDIDNDS